MAVIVAVVPVTDCAFRVAPFYFQSIAIDVPMPLFLVVA